MATNRTRAAGVVARVLQDAPAAGRTDGDLLTAFLDRRDAAAFAECVHRHGPMVLGVCRRVLGHAHDAEDAFQATFLVLARKAASVSPRNALANWLYGVAHHTAVRARAVNMNRRRREANVPTVSDAVAPAAATDDVAAVLDEELARLPDHYRAVVVLCDVEGRTRADAAAHLGCPEGSVNSRLSRARAMLARRLEARGVTLSAGAFATAAVSPALAHATIEAALAGAVGPAVATLAEGVIKAMFVTKLKVLAVVAVAVGLLGVGGVTGYRAAVGEEPTPAKAGAKKDEEPPMTELRFSARNGTVRPDNIALYVFTDDARKAFVPDATARALKPTADAVALLATNDSALVKDDRALLIEHVATGIRVGGTDFFTGTPLKEFYCVVIYPRAGLLPKPAAPQKEPAAFDRGKVATLAAAMTAFGRPTHREKIVPNKWVQTNGLGIEGEIRWWGEYGVRADAKGEITHVLLRNPFGASAKDEPKATVADERKKLQGRWMQVEATHDGERYDLMKKAAVHLLFDGDRSWSELGGGRRNDVEPFEPRPDRSPKEIDFNTIRDGKPQVIPTIYKLDEKRLTICTPGVPGPRPTAFSAAAGTKHSLLVYERLPAFRATGDLGAVRPPRTDLLGVYDDDRPAYAPRPGRHPTEAAALKHLAANADTLLTADRKLLAEYYATSILATPGRRRTFDTLYVVIAYPRAGLVPNPAKPFATFEPGTVRTRDDAISEFGAPTEWEELAEPWLAKHFRDAAGEVLWWGEYGVRADAKGGITHVLLRNPFGKPVVEEKLKVSFEQIALTITPPGLSNRTAETITVSADGKCVYEAPARPARGDAAAWDAARLVHTLPREQVQKLDELLKAIDRTVKPVAPLALHQSKFTITVTRDGKAEAVSFEGEPAGYAKLLHVFQSVAAQEYILYRLERVPTEQVAARRDVDGLVAAALGEPFAKSPYAIDLGRYVPWATRIVRKPFGEPTDDVRAAVRLVGLLRLESERDYLTDLAADRDRDVRTADAVAVGRLGGPKAIPVLRKMLRSTGAEAAWELIKQEKLATATIAEVIRDGNGPDDLSYEWLIRAYIDHWKDVPKPLDAKVAEAVRTSLATLGVKAHRTQYHLELLKLVEGKE